MPSVFLYPVVAVMCLGYLEAIASTGTSLHLLDFL